MVEGVLMLASHSYLKAAVASVARATLCSINAVSSFSAGKKNIQDIQNNLGMKRYYSKRSLYLSKPPAFTTLSSCHRLSLSQSATTVPPRDFTGSHNIKRLNTPSVHIHNEPTIFALSTAPGRSAIAIIRISGPACLKVRFLFSKSQSIW